MYPDELHQVFDAEAGERHDAFVTYAVNPDDAVLRIGSRKRDAAAPSAGGAIRLSTQTSCSSSAIARSPASARLAPLMITGGSALPVLQSLQNFSNFKIGAVPFSVLIAAGLVAVVSILINGTIVGRRYIAVGANPATAQSSGIKILRYQIGTYVAAAICYAITGILLAGFVGYASPTAGSDYLLPSIAAVVVGGTPFTGGRGSVIASGAAALFMA
ncbi:ABC-type xylose transport system permease subunit [Bradyrhizobium sp. USDA 3240]